MPSPLYHTVAACCVQKFHGSSTGHRDQRLGARARRPVPAELLTLTFNPQQDKPFWKVTSSPLSTRSQQAKTGPRQPLQPNFTLLVLNSLLPGATVSQPLRGALLSALLFLASPHRKLSSVAFSGCCSLTTLPTEPLPSTHLCSSPACA